MVLFNQELLIHSPSRSSYLFDEGGHARARGLSEIKTEGHSHWILESRPGSRIAIKGYNGCYICVDAHHNVHLSKQQDATSDFQLIEEDGCYAFKDNCGHYLAVDSKENLRCESSLETDCKFTLQSAQHHSKQHLHSHHQEN